MSDEAGDGLDVAAVQRANGTLIAGVGPSVGGPSIMTKVGPSIVTRAGPGAGWPGTLVGVNPTIVTKLIPTVVVTNDAAGFPLADTRDGSMFTDGGDANLRWYLPAWSLRPAPDPVFKFGAVRDAVPDEGGGAFNTATLTIGLARDVPPDVVALAAQQPADGSGLRFQEIAVTSLAGSILLTAKATDGSDVTHELAGVMTIDPDDPGLATFATSALLGPDVILAFVELTGTGQVSLHLASTYVTARWLPVFQPPIPVIVKPFPSMPVTGVIDTHVLRDPDDTPADAPMAAAQAARAALTRRATTMFFRFRRAVQETVSETAAIEVGSAYAGPSYRPSYTLTTGATADPPADPTTRGIVSVDDLSGFHSDASEYVELTVLGDVAGRYPSLRAVYLGQVSGTVLAIPAAYGLLRTPGGLMASCAALVDPTPQSASGCRFQLTFGLGPVVDPGDLARLTADLLTEPSLKGRSLRLALPSDLDRTTASTLQTGVASNLTFVVGQLPTTYAVALDVVDGDLPAVAAVNLLLAQLADRHQATLGRLAVRLDDAHTPPVLADVVLDLGTTAGLDDVAIMLTAGSAAQLANQTGLALRLRHQTVHTPAGFTTTDLDEPIAANGSCALVVPGDADQVLVDCELDLPADPGTPVNPLDFVHLTVENVQRIHHPLGLNAAGQLDGIDHVVVQMALDRAPETPVPTVVLSADHPIDSTAVEVPVEFALAGLVTTVALDVTPSGGGAPYQRSLSHDFLAHPILVLTSSDLAPSV